MRTSQKLYANQTPRSGGGFIVAQLVAVTAHSIAIGTLYPIANEFYDRSKMSGAYRIVGTQRLQ